MSSSIVTTTLFISSIILLFSIPNIISADNSLIKEACSSTSDFFDAKICNQILQSDPTISSTTNSRDFAILLIEAGIANATNTLAYIQNVMKNSSSTEPESSLKALQVCNTSYNSATVEFKSAIDDIVFHNDYMIATYDLLLGSIDGFNLCRGAVAAEGVTDEVVLIGVRVVPTYGLAAYEIVEHHWQENLAPPPPGLPPWSHV